MALMESFGGYSGAVNPINSVATPKPVLVFYEDIGNQSRMQAKARILALREYILESCPTLESDYHIIVLPGNENKVELHTTESIGIGTKTPSEKLDVIRDTHGWVMQMNNQIKKEQDDKDFDFLSNLPL